MPPKIWKYDQVEVREDVKAQLPDGCQLDVYKVLSGDSGKTYYIQIQSMKPAVPIYLCNCPEGTFLAPLSIVGLGPQCKHAENLAAFLKEKESRKK